jgi:hypothetical protein
VGGKQGEELSEKTLCSKWHAFRTYEEVELEVRLFTPNSTLHGYAFPVYSTHPELKFWPGDAPPITASAYQIIFQDRTERPLSFISLTVYSRIILPLELCN